jgi:HK97 family phage major capsid protein
MNLTEEVAKLRLAKSDPNNLQSAVLADAENIADRFHAQVSTLKKTEGTDGAFRFLADSMEAFKNLVEIKTELATSIALCADYDRRTRPSLTDRLSRGSFDADEAKAEKLWLPSLQEYRRLEHEGKAASIGSDPAGGYLIQTQLGPFVDRLRPASVVLQANPRVVQMDNDAMELPRLGTSATVYAVGEAQSMTESSPAYERVRLSARKYAVRSIGSTEWFEDTNTEGRRILQMDQERQLAAKIDRECLEGAGAGSSPLLGLRNIAGITQTEADAGSGNGGLPGLVDILDAMDRLERDNASPSAIFMHPRTWATFRKLDDLQERLQLQPDPTQEASRRLFGLPVYVSSQISITETYGSNNDTSYIIVADMSQVVVGVRTQNTVLYDPFSNASTGQIQMITTSRVAFNVLATEAIEIIEGVRTS